MDDKLIEMLDIEKRFPGVMALKDVSFNLYPGEVHVLIGENGAGKSTLMKILSGIYQPTAGSIIIAGKEFHNLSPQDAIQQGISIIFQELSVVDTLSVMENLFIGKIPKKRLAGIIPVADFAKMRSTAQEAMNRIGLTVPPETPVGSLSISQKQQVEIAKALVANSRIIIMDEPTSSLNQKETEQLFDIIRQLKKNNVGVVYISHKLRELRQIGDRLTVLKDGASVGTLRIDEIVSDEQIVSMMVGRELTKHHFNRDMSRVSDRILFEAKDIVRSDGKAQRVCFQVREGEILGFAGLVGAGRTELMASIFGAEAMASGEIYLDGEKIAAASPYRSIKNGVAMITENRRGTGFMHNFEIWRNLMLVHSLKRSSLQGTTGLMYPASDMAVAEEYRKKMQLKCTSLRQMTTTLSGGNQQKVIIAKWLAADAKLMIFDEPTRGIDVGAKNEIYQTMRALANCGKGIIMVSSELPELLSVCDRIAVYGGGAIRGILDATEATEEKILKMAI